ncbi:Succinate dehydrogenase/fumarate reductase, flavoprotein subunit [Sporobacter termitidis DSM 10068]|uniref:Succinate dehydrogenase/fumarate reductase, flavoprotein subunit n=1 Tax=Sporobacter termitidis DSM 10068 TaxID=1123282 RepID=A0A1M5Z1J7_9FIRM|nr:FAD-dependent oxidoreductase [Sporobacter termitidis]SHI18127.1 Succinate dehydrogenase/fumarate reductase, flavoprotein subunit [Sporobacter termitidis DSM 10068]
MSNIDPRWGSWAAPPEPIPQEKLTQREEADVVVIGAGIAGVACALRAAQTGASVLVLEKGASWSGRGGNIGVANSAFMRGAGYENDLEAVAREWIKRCGNRCDEKILWLYLNNGGRAMDWLVDILTRPEYGARPALQGNAYKGETYLEIPGSHRFFDGPMAKKGARAGGADAVCAMYSEALKLGARFFFKCPAEQLVKENGAIIGAIAKDGEGHLLARARRGVVLATGDIGGNDAMCEDLAPIANRVAAKIYAPKGGNMGDGHRMGLWAGGAFEDAPFPTILHPQAYHYANYCFLFVKPDGTRFMNEDNYVQGKSVAILRERMTYAWSIIDSDWPAKVPPTLQYGGGMFWGQDYVLGEKDFDVEAEKAQLQRGLERGVVVSAGTPEALAGKMGVPADTFAAVFERYNTMARAGQDLDFGKRRELMVPLDKPPYYALKFGPALLAVAGGLRVDTDMRVLNEAGAPVPGLYAIGNAAGGRYGVDYPILIAGNSHGTALTFGYLLGESLGGRV